MTTIDEQPWFPDQTRWHTVLVNPHGIRHLAFDDQHGQWLRIYHDGTAQPMTAAEAIFLRPSDVDAIIKISMIWYGRQGLRHPRGGRLIDEVAAGAKNVILHFAERAGHR
ncbi:hypothetical protein ACWKSP_35995 [Micromonosporaceae bacterium Da 78-11]